MKNNKQIIISVILCLLISIVVSACTSIERKAEYSTEEEYLSFDEAINRSYCIVVATLNEIIEKKDIREYAFSLEKVLRGDMVGVDDFYVKEGYGDVYVEEINHSYSTVEPKFSIGERYVLVLSKMTSVYFDYDEYMCIGDISIHIDKNNDISKTQMYHKDINVSFSNLDELITYIDRMTLSTQKVEAYGVPYTESDKLSDIVPVSQYIVQVKIDSISIAAPNANRDTYYCDVVKNIKGSTDDNIQVVLFKNTVSIGEEYILLLNKKTEDSFLYTLSSRNSVIAVSQTDKIEQINELIE